MRSDRDKVFRHSSPTPRSALIICCLLLLVALPGAAQEPASVRGTITTEAGRSVEGATVYLTDARRTLTSESGAFVFSNVTAGEYTLRVEYLGFETLRRGVRVSTGETRVVSLSLERDAIEVAELLVQVPRRRRSWVRNALDGVLRHHGTLLTQREIEEQNAGRTSDLLNRFPDVEVRGWKEDGFGRRVLVRCFGRLQEPTVYLDGGVMPNIDADLIPPEDIAALGVVTGPSVSAMTPGCGAVVILTKGMVG